MVSRGCVHGDTIRSSLLPSLPSPSRQLHTSPSRLGTMPTWRHTTTDEASCSYVRTCISKATVSGHGNTGHSKLVIDPLLLTTPTTIGHTHHRQQAPLLRHMLRQAETPKIRNHGDHTSSPTGQTCKVYTRAYLISLN